MPHQLTDWVSKLLSWWSVGVLVWRWQERDKQQQEEQARQRREREEAERQQRIAEQRRADEERRVRLERERQLELERQRQLEEQRRREEMEKQRAKDEQYATLLALSIHFYVRNFTFPGAFAFWSFSSRNHLFPGISDLSDMQSMEVGDRWLMDVKWSVMFWMSLSAHS